MLQMNLASVVSSIFLQPHPITSKFLIVPRYVVIYKPYDLKSELRFYICLQT